MPSTKGVEKVIGHVNKVYYKQCLKLFSKTGSQIPIVVRRHYIRDFVDRVFYINTNVNM